MKRSRRKKTVTIRLEPKLLEQLTETATANNRSISNTIETILANYYGSDYNFHEPKAAWSEELI